MLKGIDWFNVKTGETIYTRRPAQIRAIINLSDLGVNRQSNKGYRLGKEWTTKLRKARTDRTLMDRLVEKYGEDVNDGQILVTLFQRELRAEEAAKRRTEEAPFEQEYLDSIKQPKSSS